MRFTLAVGWLLVAATAHAAGGALPLQPARHIDIDTDEGTWLSPDLSPDGGSIVFEMLGDLYGIPSEGGEARALTRGMAFDSQPVFSPDGGDIAFISDRSGSDNIWIIARDGSKPRQLTHLDENSVFTSPAWSADGKSIFVSRYRAANNGFELWRYEVAGGAGALVIPIKTAPDQPREAWSSVLGAFPSADGRFLYFSRHVGAERFRPSAGVDHRAARPRPPARTRSWCRRRAARARTWCWAPRFVPRCRMTADSSSMGRVTGD